MSEDLHYIDDLFHSVLESNEVTPSPAVWENLNANLDKKDAELYKRRFRGWKRAALLLLLLLIGFVLYESGILKTGSGHSNENTPIATETKKHDAPAEGNQDHSASENTNKDKFSSKEDNIDLSIPENNSTSKNQEVDFNVDPTVTNNKKKEQKKWLSDQKINYGENDQRETTISLAPDKNKKDFLKQNESLLKENLSRIPLIEKSNTSEIAARLLNGIKQAQLSAISDSLLINNTSLILIVQQSCRTQVIDPSNGGNRIILFPPPRK